MDEQLQPLRERTDYADEGYDQLEKRFVDLPTDDKELIEEQFKNRLKKNERNLNIKHIAQIQIEFLKKI